VQIQPIVRRRDTSSVKAARAKSSYGRIGRWAVSAFLCLSVMVGALVMQAAAQTTDDPNALQPLNPNPGLMNGQQNVGVGNDTTQRDLGSQNSTSQNGTQNGSQNGTQYGTTITTVTTQQVPAGTQRNVPGTETGERRTNRPLVAPEPPTEFQRMVTATTGRQLQIFGASLFVGDVPSTFAPVNDIPVAPDYVIGPGDELRLQVWGQVNQQGSFLVDRTGTISVPQLGTVHVAGQRYDQLNDFLRNEFGRVYRNFNLNVTMGQLRSIQVFVVGQARRPGSYTISSLSTLLNALFASGGPTPQGSLRDIQVMRGAQTVVHFDLYDLLLHGDKSKDVPLSPGDVIFIPAVGPQVALLGSVNVPAIYELKKGAATETTVGELLELGGGRTSSAAGTQVRLERIVDRTALSVIDVDLSKPDRTVLQNGDIVSVISIVDRFKNAVTLRGNVANPGRYVWFPGMRISDLIPNKEALVTRNYWEKRNQLGQIPRDYQPEPRDRDQQTEPRDTTSTGALQAGGSGQTQTQASGTGTATATDRTTQGGATRTSQGGGSVGAALTATDGIFTAKTDVVLSAPDINWSYAVIERQSASDLKTSLLSFNLGKIILDGDQSQNLELLPGDVVTIFSTSDLRVPSSQQTRFVRLEGEFTSAGVYSVRPGETLRQLLTRAGGMTPEAYLYASEFTRLSTKRVERQRLSEYADQLDAQLTAATSGQAAKALNPQDSAAASAQAASAQEAISRLRQIEPVGRIVLPLTPDSRGIDDVPDLALEDGDRFVVPRVPSSVNVEGQVYSANAFVFERGRQVRDYLKMAGGPSRQADTKRTFVVRADGSVYSQQYGDLPKARVFPGDTIVVPLQLEHKAVLRTLVDIATIAGQFGIAIAAITVLK
jgi:polysaccharide export outer membrane protein